MSTLLTGLQLGNQITGSGLSIYQGIRARDQSREFAAQVTAAAMLDAREAGRAFTRRQGEITTSYAAGGVDVTRGTALDQRRANAFRAEKARARILWNAAMRGYRAERQGDASLATGLSLGTRQLTNSFRTLLDTPFGKATSKTSDEALPRLGVPITLNLEF